MRGVIGLVAALAAGTIASALLMRGVPPQFHVDMLQPIPVATNWGSFGALLWGVFFIMLCAASAAYVLLLRDILGDRVRGARVAVIAASLVSLAVLLCWYTPLFSSDAYAYAAYGELARLGVNPYGLVVHRSNDPLISAAIWQWSGALPACVYGEAFVALARGIVGALHAQPVRIQLDAVRAVAALSLPGGALLLGSLRSAPLARRFATAAVACNPVLLWCAAEGHNDALMLAIALAGIAVARRAPAVGIAIASLAALVKIPAAAVTAGIALVQMRTRSLAYGAALFVFAAAVVTLGSMRWLASFASHTAGHGMYAPQASLQGALFAVLQPLAHEQVAATAAVTVVIVAALLILAIRSQQPREHAWIGAALSLWLLIPNPYPWYDFWLLPLLAVLPPRRAIVATVAFSLGSCIRYLPDASVTMIGPLAVAVSLATVALYMVAWCAAASPATIRLV